ncbi:MAG: urea ABC transporter ATP-binding subunit UrtE [Tepidisphaeraceae bacterium]
MLTIENINFSYGNVQSLRGVSMKMPPGEVTAIMGRNGVGKTTLIKNIMGILSPSGGEIRLSGKNMTRLAPHQRARAGIGLVPQGRQIFPKLTVEENLLIGLQARTDGKKSIPAEAYETFPVLGKMRARRGGDLSGGQQQQLAIARALVGDPKVLLLDEPTEGIQPNIIQLIGEVLQKLATQRNMAIVLVEQYLDFVRDISNSFYVLNRGRVVANGPTAELSADVVTQHLKV